MQIDKLNVNINSVFPKCSSVAPAGKEGSSGVAHNAQKGELELSMLEIMSAEEVNVQKIKQAKALLESGELLSLENITSAAEKIVKSGF